MVKKRTVLVTGGTGGLGGAVVRTLHEAGWRVVAPARKDADFPEGVTSVAADLTVPEEVEAAVEVAAGEPGAPLRP